MGMAFAWLGKRLARYLSQEVRQEGLAPPMSPKLLLAHLRAGDVLLVEGHSRISSVIKYMTQSTWSHAALYVGFRWQGDPVRHNHCFVEADLVQGVRTVCVDEYAAFHSRICRPVGLNDLERDRVCDYTIARIGNQYDLRNVFDLARYMLPLPPVSQRFRAKLLLLGSGDPTRAICSTLIAQAFHSIRYPIMPLQVRIKAGFEQESSQPTHSVSVEARHYSFFSPRDFDVSPYFQVIKPSVERGFDFHVLQWLDEFELEPNQEKNNSSAARRLAMDKT